MNDTDKKMAMAIGYFCASVMVFVCGLFLILMLVGYSKLTASRVISMIILILFNAFFAYRLKTDIRA